MPDTAPSGIPDPLPRVLGYIRYASACQLVVRRTVASVLTLLSLNRSFPFSPPRLLPSSASQISRRRTYLGLCAVLRVCCHCCEAGVSARVSGYLLVGFCKNLGARSFVAFLQGSFTRHLGLRSSSGRHAACGDPTACSARVAPDRIPTHLLSLRRRRRAEPACSSPCRECSGRLQRVGRSVPLAPLDLEQMAQHS